MSRRVLVLIAIAAVLVTGVVAARLLERNAGPPAAAPPVRPAAAAAARADPEFAPPLPAAAPVAPAPAPAPSAAETEAARLAAEAEAAERARLEAEKWKAVAEERQAGVEKLVGSRLSACDLLDTPFVDAVRAISEANGVRMTIDSDIFAQVESMKLTMKFKSASLAKVVRTIAAVGGVTVEADGDGLRFRQIDPAEAAAARAAARLLEPAKPADPPK